MVRVIVEHAPNLFAIIGLHDEAECAQMLTMVDAEKIPHTYYRARSTPRWVLYRAAVSGWGAGQPGDTRPPFESGQR